MGKKESVPKREYTEEFKAEAVKPGISIGGNAAAKRLGIPQSTMTNWIRRSKAGSCRSRQVPRLGLRCRNWKRRMLVLVLENHPHRPFPDLRGILLRCALGCAHRLLSSQELESPGISGRFTPTGASWLNMIEAWLGILTRKSVRRGSFVSVKALVAHIRNYIEHWNAHPTPFVWTKKPAEIIRKAVRRGR